MKMHRFQVFVIDHEGMGVGACQQEIEKSRYAFVSAKMPETADIGDFEDSHELNQSGTPVERFNSYFATQPQAPQGAVTPLTAEQIDKAYRDVWSTVPHANRLTAFAHAIYSLKGAPETPEGQKP